MRRFQFRYLTIAVILFALTAFLFGCFHVPGVTPGPESRNRPGRGPDFVFTDGRAPVFIQFRSRPGPNEEALVRGLGGQVRFTYWLVPAIAANVPEAAIKALQKNPNVALVEADGEVHAHGFQAELDRTWGVKHIGAGQAHEQQYTGDGVRVAILDTGISSHSDLSRNLAGGVDYTGSPYGYDDVHSHGTHVAGTVAALRNQEGVVGVAPDVSLYAVKVLGDSGSGSWSSVVRGLEWCVENGIDITNNSYGSTSISSTAAQAFDNAYQAGILHVASAGNRGEGADTVGFPARLESVIAVAATDRNNNRASFSSTGPDVELAAPGVSIYSTLNNGGYGTKSGTSMAAPHVAGVAALVMASSGGNVRHILRDTADNLGNTAHFGYGLVNAAEAAGVDPEPTPEPDPDPVYYTLEVSATGGGSVTNPGEGTFTYEEKEAVELEAVAGNGYRFVNWTGDVADPDSFATTVTMDGNKTVTANFELIPITQYTLTMQVNPSGGGTATPETGDHVYDEGTVVDIEAIPAAGYRFVNWTGDTSPIADPASAETTIKMTGDYAITAVFERIGTMHVAEIDMALVSHPVWTSATATVLVLDEENRPVGGATVNGAWSGATSGSASGTTGSDGKITFESARLRNPSSGTTFTFCVKGVEKTGWVYEEYDSQTCASIMVGSGPVHYTLTVSSNGGGSVNTPGEGSFTYQENTVVSLKAAADAGYRFTEWSGNTGTVENTTSAETTIEMTGDFTITANFTFEETPTSPPPDDGTMHVAEISMAFVSHPVWTSATATVLVLDAQDQPVGGATVNGAWSEATSGTASGTTGSDGKITFESGRLRNPSSGTTFTFCVTGVEKTGWVYDAESAELCGSISVR